MELSPQQVLSKNAIKKLGQRRRKELIQPLVAQFTFLNEPAKKWLEKAPCPRRKNSLTAIFPDSISSLSTMPRLR